MRKDYQETLKQLFHESLLKSRKALNFTQAQMAERLLIDTRSYVELDHGSSMCGSLTFALYLTTVCTDPMQFISDICETFKSINHPNISPTPIVTKMIEDSSYRNPVKVVRNVIYGDGSSFPVCPHCNTPMEREYQNFCDRCGQKLDWSDYLKSQSYNVPR